MKNTNPDTWRIPADWDEKYERKVSLELQALQEFSRVALKISSDVSVQLDSFEPGYLKVDLFHKQVHLAGVYANIESAGVVYSLYAPIKHEEEEEYHFRTVAEGVRILTDVLFCS